MVFSCCCCWWLWFSPVVVTVALAVALPITGKAIKDHIYLYRQNYAFVFDID